MSVHDDGVNAGTGGQAGVGLTSIRERAAELGGRCSIQLDRTGGRVDVYLPLGVGSIAPSGSDAADTAARVVGSRHDAPDRRRRRPRRRTGLRALLSAVDGYEVVEVVGTGTEAVRAAVIIRPDVVIMDIQMPGMNGSPGPNGCPLMAHCAGRP